MNCNKCQCEIDTLINNEKICRVCYRKRWNDNRAIRKANGTLKSTVMPQEYHSAYLKNWVKGNRGKVIDYAKKARQASPEKAAAREQLNKALKYGRITKQNCIVCNSPESEAHHEDYSKPLEVFWYCRKHHKQIHKKATE